MESPQINESFPKRIRSVSARLFSIHNESTTVHAKRTSCHIMASSPEHHSILNPSKWFPRMRCRSSSSASSTFSLVFSSSVNSSFTEPCLPQFSESHHLEHHVSLESVSSELEELYKVAKEEVYTLHLVVPKRHTNISLSCCRLHVRLKHKALFILKVIDSPLLLL